MINSSSNLYYTAVAKIRLVWWINIHLISNHWVRLCVVRRKIEVSCIILEQSERTLQESTSWTAVIISCKQLMVLNSFKYWTWPVWIYSTHTMCLVEGQSIKIFLHFVKVSIVLLLNHIYKDYKMCSQEKFATIPT